MKKYEIVIGLEVHIQLNTQSKAFCADSTAFGTAANTNVSAISLAHPGTLPFFNKKQLESAIKLGLALGSTINLTNFFDRKNYFYADLPKGFQTTQDRVPVCSGGEIELRLSTGKKRVAVHHFHMEEDAGKSIHDRDDDFSLIDLNRAGVPLLELVTEPDFQTAEEVSVFMTEMRRLVRWLGISDGNMEEGSLRCDVNISVRKPGEPLGTRCEVKNINSMRFARKAIAFESERQIKLLEMGEKIVQQTRSFDPVSGTTAPLRDKEEAHDYRYFPEPDLPPVIIKPELIEKLKNEQPEQPWIIESRLIEVHKINPADAAVLTEELATANYFLKLLDAGILAKPAANFLINNLIPLLKNNNKPIDFFEINSIKDFIGLIEKNEVSNSQAMQKLLPAMFENPEISPTNLATKLNLFTDKNSDGLEGLIDQILANWPDKVIEFKKGKKGLIGLFTGEIMKASKGKADPKEVSRILLEKLK